MDTSFASISGEFHIFYVNWWITDPEVDSRLSLRTWNADIISCHLYLVVNCSSYLPGEYRSIPFREVTPGMVSVFSAQLGSTSDTYGASVYEALSDGSDSAETEESAVGAALFWLCSRLSQQRLWFLR